MERCTDTVRNRDVNAALVGTVRRDVTYGRDYEVTTPRMGRHTLSLRHFTLARPREATDREMARAVNRRIREKRLRNKSSSASRSLTSKYQHVWQAVILFYIFYTTYLFHFARGLNRDI